MKRIYAMKWFIGVLFGLLTLTAVAAPVAPASPRDMVIDTSQKMLAALKKDKDLLKQNPQRIYELVSEIVLPHFDFTTMSKWVLGKNWRTLNPGQQQRFTTEFRTLLVRTYAVSLSEYQDQKLNYLPLKAAPSADDVTVRTEVLRGGGPAIPINYSMHLTANGWKVYDVVIDGVSLVINYRTSFATQIRTGGVDKLIEDLVARNQRPGT